MENRVDISMMHLVEELEWVRRIIETATVHAVPTDMFAAGPPVLDESSCYSDFVKKYQLDLDQRFILALALSAHLRPSFLDTFMKKNPVTEEYYSEIGGKRLKSSNGFLPTAETAIFLLCRRNLQRRAELMPLFDTDGVLAVNDIVCLAPVEPGEPVFSGVLVVSKDVISQLLYGKNMKPDLRPDFPAKLLSTAMNWDDLILQPQVYDQLNDIIRWIDHNKLLMSDPFIGKKIKPGFRSLFYGPPGTGKTLAATLLGKKTGYDVYRIDLSTIVSKYIGETEKNLARLFDRAERKGWILFFDEADALFGKRTTTSSANDRYANQEVSYLLQRIETYDGLVILATNLKNNIDTAFLRRFQSIVYFPLPKAEERLQLWQNAFSEIVPADRTLDFKEIAEKYELTGSLIINIVLHITLKAIDDRQPVITMKMLRDGIARELAKEGRSL